MYLTGEAALKAPETALERLEAFLTAQLSTSEYIARFKAVYPKYQGLQVATPNTPGKRIDDFFSRQPFLFLEIAGNDPMHWKRRIDGVTYQGTRHELEISIEVVVSDSCRPVEAELKPALIEVIGDGFYDLAALCIEETEVRAGMGRYPLPNRINPHTLTCAVHALRKAD